jgi:hypothetical protein
MRLNLNYLNIFKNKNNVVLMDSKWTPIKLNVKFKNIPNKGEFLYFNEKYHKVLSIIHQLTNKQTIYVVVEEFNEIEAKFSKKN